MGLVATFCRAWLAPARVRQPRNSIPTEKMPSSAPAVTQGHPHFCRNSKTTTIFRNILSAVVLHLLSCGLETAHPQVGRYRVEEVLKRYQDPASS